MVVFSGSCLWHSHPLEGRVCSQPGGASLKKSFTLLPEQMGFNLPMPVEGTGDDVDFKSGQT